MSIPSILDPPLSYPCRSSQSTQLNSLGRTWQVPTIHPFYAWLCCSCCSVAKLRLTLQPHRLYVACQASLSFTVSWNLLKLVSIESVMPSNHLTLFHPLLHVFRSNPVYQFIPPAPSPSVPTYPSLHLHLYSCSANRFTCTIFLDSTYKC